MLHLQIFRNYHKLYGGNEEKGDEKMGLWGAKGRKTKSIKDIASWAFAQTARARQGCARDLDRGAPQTFESVIKFERSLQELLKVF